MEIVIRGNNIKVSDTLKDYTEKQLNKLDRYLPNIREVRVDFSRQNTKRGENLSIAQITLRHERGAILRAEEKLFGTKTDDFEAAINNAVDKMYRRIDRFKGKRSRKSKRGQERIAKANRYLATDEELVTAEELPKPDAIKDIYEDDTLEIVRRKQIAIEAMNEQEAIEQMELLGHSFFMFLNDDTGSINVLYRRSSDGYGVLIPLNS